MGSIDYIQPSLLQNRLFFLKENNLNVFTNSSFRKGQGRIKAFGTLAILRILKLQKMFIYFQTCTNGDMSSFYRPYTFRFGTSHIIKCIIIAEMSEKV